MMSVAISAVAATIKARVALHHHLAAEGHSGGFLTDDHDCAIIHAIAAATADVAMALVPYISDFRIDDTTALITLEVNTEGVDTLLRPVIEVAIAARALALIFAGMDETQSQLSDTDFARLIDSARTLVGADTVHSLRPVWY